MSLTETESPSPSTPFFPWPARYEAMMSSEGDPTAWTRAGQHMMRGLMTVALHQMELGQGLIGDALEDMRRFGEARGPEEIMKAELAFAGRQTERLVSAARQINDELRRCYFGAAELAINGETEGTPARPRRHATLQKNGHDA